MSRISPHLLLRAPTPTQLRLSFCEADPRDLKRWITTLPKANLGETARLLYQGMGELNQLVTTADIRLQLLELLRPEVYYVCRNLERHFLNQSIVLDERARKVANLCQALQNQLATGYKQVVVQGSSGSSGKDRTAILLTGVQRALHCLNGPLIRACLLYSPVPETVWLELHQLYQVALENQLQNQVIADSLSTPRKMSIQQTYAVALLLGTSRSNQLRQNAIARLTEVIETWAALPRVQPASDASTLFAVQPALDAPPRYKTLFTPEQLPGSIGINTIPLVDALKQFLDMTREQRAESRLVPSGFSLDLLQHLSATWGDVAERTFQRTAGHGDLTLCIGMSALHYYLSGERTFGDILQRPTVTQSAEFNAGEKLSGWSQALDANPIESIEPGLPYEEIQYHLPQADGGLGGGGDRNFPTFALQIVNHSPGGYCLAWPNEVPAQLQAGEMLGIQDAPSHGWSVAVVRWIRQVITGGTQMGIELVAPHAQPCGLQLVRSSEENSQFLRGLLLPEIRAIDIPATLLAPRLPFQEGNKVIINTDGEERPASLSKRLASTGSFNQFEYRHLEQAVPLDGPAAGGAAGTGGEDDFDSLWKDL